MIWKTLKALITAICFSFATVILIAAHFSLASFAFACFLAFLGTVLWIDFTKPLSTQNLSPAERSLARLGILVLVIFFVSMFIYSILNDDVHLNGRGFVQLITALLKVL